MKTLLKLLLVLNIVVIVCTLCSYLSPFVNPEKSAAISFFGLAYPWLLLLNMCFIFTWLFLKPKYGLISFVTILAGWVSAGNIYGFSGENTYKDGIDVIRVMSYNIQNARETDHKNATKRKQKKEEFEAFLKGFEDVDILCVQEAGFNSADIVENALSFKNKHQIKSKGTIIYSQFPFIKTGQIEFGTKTNSCLWADIVVPNDTFRLYCVHLQSNRITKETEEVVEKHAIGEKETWKKVLNILSNYKNYTIRRTSQAESILAHKNKSPYKTMVCGDLNDTPQSYVYRIISKDMKDSFKEQGQGFGTTYAGIIPALRIDYLLADKEVEILEHRIIKKKFSDHYPIQTVLRVP